MKASSLLEPQQFGSWLHEPFLARASEPGAEHGRHALGAFLTLRLADRFRPDEEPSHPLALAYQVRATRDYLLDLHPQNPEVKHLLEVVRLADAVQKGAGRSMLWPPLLAYAHWLEQELQLEEGLDVVETALGLTDGTAATEEIAGLLQRGRILRHLGRFDEASASYQAGRAKASQAGDKHSELLGRIGEAIVMQQLGDLTGSEGALRGILADAEATGDQNAQARAHHDLGAVLLHLGQSRDAIVHLFLAFELYDHASDRIRALSDVGESLKREGQHDAAKDAFEIVLKTAPATTQIRIPAMIALLELSALTRDRVGFVRWSKAVGQMREELPAERAVDYYLQLGRGQAAFGQRAKGEQSLAKALARAEQYHLNDYVLRIQAELGSVKQASAQREDDAIALSRRAENRGQLAEVVGKLRALRMAS